MSWIFFGLPGDSALNANDAGIEPTNPALRVQILNEYTMAPLANIITRRQSVFKVASHPSTCPLLDCMGQP